MRLPKRHVCPVCKIIFSSPQLLLSHFQAFHSNHHVSTSLAPRAFPYQNPNTFVAPRAFCYQNLNRNPNTSVVPRAFRYQNLNRNPNLGLPTGVRFYRGYYFDNHGRFHRGFPPVKYAVQKQPQLLNLFPVTSSESDHMLPLLRQLEQYWRPDATVKEIGGSNSSSIDLSLRL